MKLSNCKKINYPFKECIECTDIKECKHPDVNLLGRPICPLECVKPEEINTENEIPS